MGKIVLLDDLTINKIAAGEVIERPASVVKELVENSIDAGASEITIEIKNGGIEYIRVTDNGKGLQSDDMEIAFERHATSKIRVAQDIEKVRTMGFRGEALASIAAISKVTMTSKTKESTSGNVIVVEGGTVLSKEESGCPDGTSITIENLFYNTPVRYKFLRKDFTEAGYIEDAVNRIALVHPEIAIKLINSGKTVIQTPGSGKLKDVVYGVYGKEIAENIIDVNYEYEDIKISGVIGNPKISRSNRANQLFFVNKRYIKDKTLYASAEQAYKNLIAAGKFGFVVLNIEVEPQKVDVNVHPAKLEVRFEEEQKVFKAVYSAIKETLQKNGFMTIEEQVRHAEPKNNNVRNTYEKAEKNQVEYEDIIEEEPKSKGFFRKFLSKKEEEPTLVEQLYESRKQSAQNAEEYDEGINSAIKTIKQMQQLVSKYEEKSKNKITTDWRQTPENKAVAKEIEIDNIVVDEPSIELQNINNGINETETAIIPEIEKANETIEETLNAIETEVPNEAKIEETNKTANETVEDILDGIDGEISNETQLEVANKPKNETVEEILNGIDMETSNEPQLEETNTPAKEILSPIDLNTSETIESAEVNTPVVKTTEEKANYDSNNFEKMYATVFGKFKLKNEDTLQEQPQSYNIQTAGEILKNENISLFGPHSNVNIPKYKFIGIGFENYIIIEIEKELYIINQNVAKGKILYEDLKNRYNKKDSNDSQLMLLPDIINLTPKQMDIAEDNANMLKKAGFMFEEFGENTIKLSGVPSICMDLDTKDLFVNILDEINKVARTEKQEVENKFIATVANKIAENTKTITSKEEADELMQKLLTTPNAFSSHTKNQLAVKMSKADIEKKFSRR